MGSLSVELVPALSDNYVYLVHEPEQNISAVVDPAEEAPVVAALERRGRGLDLILNTHHHADHTGGNAGLVKRYGARLIGPRAEKRRIPGMDETLAEGDEVRIGAETGQVFDTPGHTSGHISLWFPESRVLFAGDTLFAVGCGRLFEGTPDQMWDSLLKLRELPDDTTVYCGHEYTLSNARFAVTVDPHNKALAERLAVIEDKRARNEPTIPSQLGEEKRTNPFLRADDSMVANALDMRGADPVAVFAEIRARKDRF